MKTIINFLIRIFPGARDKLAGQHTKMALAADALLVISSGILALVNALIVAQTGDYGGALVMLAYSEEFRAAFTFWMIGAGATGIAIKQDKNTAAMLAMEADRPELAKAIAGGSVSPLVIIPPPEGEKSVPMPALPKEEPRP